MRLCVLRVQLQRLAKTVDRIGLSSQTQQTDAASVEGAHLIFATVEAVRIRTRLFAIELLQRLVDVALRQTDESEKPMEAECGIAVAARDLPILYRRSLTKDRFGLPQPPSRDVNHRHLKVRECEIGIERQHIVGRAQPLLSPGGMTQPEKVTPVGGFECYGPAGAGDGFRCFPGADEHEAERGMCFGERIVEPDGPPRMVDGVRQQRLLRNGIRASRFVRGKLSAGQTRQRQRVFRIDRDCLLEAGGRSRDLAQVERFQAQPRLGIGAVGLEAGRLAGTARRRRHASTESELAGELRDDPVLQFEDLRKRPVDLGVRQRLACLDVNDTRRDAYAFRIPLVAADDRKAGADVSDHLVKRSARQSSGLDDAAAIDDAKAAGGSEVAGDCFGDAG